MDINSLVAGFLCGLRSKSVLKVPVYPTMAASNTWYKRSKSGWDITEINIVDSYTPTGNETESWAADADGIGSIMCYVTDTVLTIAGNGSGKIMANENSDSMFCPNVGYPNMFGTLASINGLEMIDTSNVTNMRHMFSECFKLTSLDLSSWDTSNVTNMYQMFANCEALTSLDLSGWNTSNVTDMGGMFWCCKSLTSIDLSNFDTSNVTDMGAMFYRWYGLTSLDLRSFDTNKVTDMSWMFMDCEALTVIYVGSDWTTENADTGGMFSDCGVSEVTYV